MLTRCSMEQGWQQVLWWAGWGWLQEATKRKGAGDVQFELRSEGKGGQMRDSPAPGPSTVLVGPALGTFGVAFRNGAAKDQESVRCPQFEFLRGTGCG